MYTIIFDFKTKEGSHLSMTLTVMPTIKVLYHFFG